MKQQLLRYLFIFLAFFIFSTIEAQTPTGPDFLKVEYESLSTAPDFINICGGPEKITVIISNKNGNNASKLNITAAIKLFTGVNFVRLVTAESSPGVSVKDTTNKNNPILNLPNITPITETGIRVTFEISADCTALDQLINNPTVSVFDTWTIKYSFAATETVTEVKKLPEYRDAFAVPFFTIAPQKNYSPKKGGDCFSRDITINNSGLEGFVDHVQYKNLQARGASIKSILVNGQPIAFTKQAQANNDTLIIADITGNYFKLNKKGTGGAGNGNNFFDPDENVIVTENVCIANCNFPTSSTHSSSWGCYGKMCNTVTANDIIPIGVGSANPVFTISDPSDKNVGYCQEGQSTMTIKNDGFEVDPGFGVMKNVLAGIGFGSGFQTQVKGYKLKSLTIAGKSVPLTYNNNLNNALISMDKNPLFATDPDGPGGLDDADADGFFDDLKIGQSFKIVAKYEFDCNTAVDTGKLCTNNRNVALTGAIKYRDACDQVVTKDKPNYKNITNSNNTYEDTSDPDAYIGIKDTFYVEHFEERSIFFFEKSGGNERFYAKVYLPKGVLPVIGATGLFKNGNSAPEKMLSNYIKNDTLYMFFDGSGTYITGSYRLKMAFIADCNANVGATKFPFEFGFNTPSCNCYATWYCNTLNGPILHGTTACKLPPCPKGVRTTSFDVQRTTFGFTDATFKTPVNPANVNRNVAISCDSVRFNIKNVIGDTPLTDNVGFVVEYGNIQDKDVDPLDPKAIFLFGSGRLRIKQNGADKFCNIPSSAAKTVATGGNKKTTIDVSNCLKQNNITLSPGDEVELIGMFEINPDGPYAVNFRKVPNLRAYGFATISGTEYACDNFGKNFTLAKNKTVFDYPTSASFPKGCETAEMEYRLITINNGFNDYFKNEYREAIKVDSIKLKFDPKLLEAFSNLTVDYSIPGDPVNGDNYVKLPDLSTATNGIYTVSFDKVNVIPAYNNISYFSFNMRLHATPNCKSKFGSASGDNRFLLDATLQYKDRYYAKTLGNGKCSPDSMAFVNNDLYYSEPPTFTFNAASNPNYDVKAGVAEWTVKMCNSSYTSNAGASFLSVDLKKGKLELIEATDVSDPFKSYKLDIKSYSNNDFAFLLTKPLLKSDGTNASKDVCNTIKLKAKVKDCSTVETVVSTGWNCTPYDTLTWNPTKNPPCDEYSTKLRALILEPALDALLEEGFKKDPELCDTIALDLLVRNTGLANAFDIKTQIILPTQGLILVPGSVSIAYPYDKPFKKTKADPVKVGTTVKGDIYEFADFKNLNDFLNTNGLPGFNTNAPNDSNQFKIRYKVVTDCNFKSGTVSFFNVQGKKGCGQLTNTEAGESLPIKLKNAVFTTDQRFFDIELTDKTVIVPSSTSTIELKVTNTTKNPSDSTDLVSINLPPDLEYIPKSAIGVAPAGYNPGEPDILDIGVYKILSWNVPVGLTQGQEAIINFKVTTPNFDCNTIPSFDATIATVIRKKVSCKLNPNSAPCIVSVITSNGGDANLQLPVGLGAKMSIEFASPTSICFDFAQEQINVTGNIVNADTVAITATNLVVTYYYDKNDNNVLDAGEKVIKTFNATGPIPIGTKIPFAHTILSNVDDLCKIKAEIKAEGATCGINSVKLPTPRLLNAGADKSFCASGEKVTHILGDDNCTHNTYKYKWTALTQNSLQYLSSTTIANPTVNFIWTGAMPSEFCYVLETDRGNGCTPTKDTVCIRRSPALVLTMGKNLQTPPNTSIKLSPVVSGGTPPYSYNWDPASSLDNPKSAMPIAKPNGTIVYNLTVTDAAGCNANGNIVVTTHLCDTITAIVSNDTTICAGQSVQLQGGGGTNYWWIPNPNNPAGGKLDKYFVPNPIFTSSVPNVKYYYTVLVTSTTQQNAMDTATVVITVTGGPTADITVSGLVVCGGSPVKLLGSGGKTYMWTDATGLPLGNDASLQVSPKSTTTYNLKVTDGSGCIATATKTITPNDAPIVVASPDVTICLGNIAILTATASGGSTSTYAYSWSPVAGLTNPNTAKPIAKPTSTTTYQVTVVDQNGCTASDDVKVQVDSCNNCIKPAIENISITNADCGKSNGSISFTMKGETADKFTFKWNTTSGTVAANGTITGLPTGTYTVIITRKDDSTCVKDFKFAVPSNPSPTVAIVVTDKTTPDCNTPNGSVKFNITFGAGFTFPADTIITDAKGTVVKNGNLAKGNYTVTVKDKIGCATASVAFSIDTCFSIPCMKPTLDVISVSKAICGKSNGSIELTPWGNPMKYSYTWTPNLGTSGGAGEIKTDLPGGNYTVTLAFMANPLCNATFNIVVPNIDFAKANITKIETKDAECDSLGSVVVTATYDTGYLFPAETVVLKNGKVEKNGHLSSGNYIVQIRNINGCVTAEAPFTINKGGCIPGVIDPNDSTLTAKINVGLLAINNKCFGDTNGKIDYTVTYGSKFALPATITVYDKNNNVATNGALAAGDYCVTVKDKNGVERAKTCTTITQPAQLQANTSVVAACKGFGGGINLAISGGSQPYNFDWSDLNTTNEPQNRSNLAIGTYNVNIADANACKIVAKDIVVNLCKDTTTVVIDPTDTTKIAKVNITTITNNICFGAANGKVLYTVSYGSNFGVPGVIMIVDKVTNIAATNGSLPSGDYYVVVMDSFGKIQAKESFTIKSPTQLTAKTTATDVCKGVNGKIDLSVSGGVSPYTYSWSDLNTTNQPQNRTDLTIGTFNVTVSDANACTVVNSNIVISTCKDTTTLDTTKTANISLGIVINNNCFGEAGGNVDYKINYGSKFEGPATVTILDVNNVVAINSNLAAGDYCIIVKDKNGIERGKSCFKVTQPDPISISYKIAEACKGQGGAITLAVNGGTKPYRYDWADLAGNNDPQDRKDLKVGKYSVIVTDEKGCTSNKNDLTITTCKDTTTINPTACNWPLYAKDSLTVGSFDCSKPYQLCVPASKDSLLVTLDGKAVSTTECGGNNYAYFSLPNNGSGSFTVKWSVGTTAFQGQFNTIKALVDSMNTWDPKGNWTNAVGLPLIFGGNNGAQYSALDIVYSSGQVPLTFALNFMKSPVGSYVNVPNGSHTLAFKNTKSGCTDTLQVEVDCKPLKKLTIDTIYVNLKLNESDSACMDLTELTAAVQSSSQSCSKVYVASLAKLVKPACFKFTGVNLGSDTTCIVTCDANGVCDTTIVIIHVTKRFENIYDTIKVDDQKKICFHGSDYGLTDPLTITNTCDASSGKQVLFGIVKQCIDYAGLEIGTDTACIKICDAKGICGEFKIIVTVIPSNTKEIVYDTVYVGESKKNCITPKLLKGSGFTMVNSCVNKDVNAGFKVDNVAYCLSYTGINIGNDTACISVCDKFGSCHDVTYYINVRFPGPLARNDRDTVAITQTIIVNEMKNDSIPGGLKSMNLIVYPRWGSLKMMADNKIAYTAVEEPCGRVDTFTYRICNVAGCDTATVYIYIRCINVHVNTGFSPNNDGVNDAFHVSDIELFPDSDVRIFNRWGNQVYGTIGYQNNWTGTWNNGQALPDGTYFYCVDLHDKDKTVLTGYVQLQR